MVTRTIVTTKANVLCLDIVAGEPFNEVVVLPRTYKDDKALMKQVSKLIDNEQRKAVHVVDKEEVETLYGMTEQDFIKLAKPMDENRKFIDTEEGDEEEVEEGEAQEAKESEAGVTEESETEAPKEDEAENSKKSKKGKN